MSNEKKQLTIEDYRTNQCVVVLVDIDENCTEGDLAKIVEISNGNIYIQYSSERGMTSNPIQVTLDMIEPFTFK